VLALFLAAALTTTNDITYEQLLTEDDRAMAMPAPTSLAQSANYRARLRRIEADYKGFIARHPDHAPAVAAYGGFLYDQGRHDEALALWERALKLDPKFARVYNDLAAHYGHYGRAGDALRYHQKAYELDPTDPLYHFNWATTCILFRKDAQNVYGWSEDEIFRHSLDEFRKARDLATNNYEYATAYAESFVLWKKADWQEALAAWQYCVKMAPTELDRQRAYSNVARAYIRLNRHDAARASLDKVTSAELRPIREAIGRQLNR
jgi:tetratricopeptide (TPR) repeat protein